MASTVPVENILQSAIAVGDWLLSCLQVRRKDRFDTIFTQLYQRFREDRVDEEAYLLFVSALEDVFEFLAEAQREGCIAVESSSPTPTEELRRVEKPYQELLNDTEDFLMFLLVFAKTLDGSTPRQVHLCDLITALSKVPNDEKKICATTFPEVRLKAMMAGFNFLSANSVFKYDCCISIIEFAAKFGLFERIIPYINSMEEWVLSGNRIKTKQRRNFYALLCREIRASGLPKMGVDLLALMLKMMKEFEATSPEEMKGVDGAVELLKLAISITEVVTFDEIISSKTVQSLAGTSHENLLELARIFYEGDQEDFEAFVVKYPQAFKTYGLDATKCKEKIQLLVVASMTSALPPAATSSPHQQLPLQDISDRLKLPLRDAESLTVKAIGLGIIDGRIDQLNGVVGVRSGLARSFGKDQWEQLQMRLTDLKRNVAEVLEKLEKHEESMLMSAGKSH